MPPAPLESRLLAPDTICTDRFDLTEHGGASGFDEQSCFDAAFAALYPAWHGCFALQYTAVGGACYVCRTCEITESVVGSALYRASWHYSPPTPPPSFPPFPPPPFPPPPLQPPPLQPPPSPSWPPTGSVAISAGCDTFNCYADALRNDLLTFST